MAGTTLTLQQPTKRKRDYDLTEEIEVERDTRHQTCLECTLSWPWVIFHRNEDGSRNVCPLPYFIRSMFTYNLNGLMIVGSEEMFYLLRYK
jgi:hypothetical protein